MQARISTTTQHPPKDRIQFIADLFGKRGGAAYFGESVSQTEHALQSAWAAEKSGAEPALIVAALLHDIGHLLSALPEDCARHGQDDCHEELGAAWVEQAFGPAVSEPIRLHVAAKRCLCAQDPGYWGRLSPASQLSLRLQGGAFSSTELDEFFSSSPYAQAAVHLRHWDEQAKVPGLATPSLQHFMQYFEAAAATSILSGQWPVVSGQ